MQPLPVSSKQQDQLKEMVEALTNEHPTLACFMVSTGLVFIPDKEPAKKARGEYVHWYELCLTELAPKIESNLSTHLENGNLRYDYNLNQVILMKNEHPIDFLYNEFKKTPLWKKESLASK